MLPITAILPKPLVKVAGRSLIDFALDKLHEAGVEIVVVNVHHFADMLEAHLRTRTTPRIVISDERDALLETGGGVKKALPLLGGGPFITFNSDSMWIEGQEPNLRRLVAAWDPERMDILILLAARDACYGYGRPEGFIRDDAGRLTHSNNPNPPPPYNNIGFQIIKPQLLDGLTGAFSILPIWKRLSAEGRLHGAVMDGEVIHVSDPAGRDHAERRLDAPVR